MKINATIATMERKIEEARQLLKIDLLEVVAALRKQESSVLYENIQMSLGEWLGRG